MEQVNFNAVDTSKSIQEVFVLSVDFGKLSEGDVVVLNTRNSQYEIITHTDNNLNKITVEIINGTGGLVGEKGEIHRLSLSVGEMFYFGENRHTSSVQSIEIRKENAFQKPISFLANNGEVSPVDFPSITALLDKDILSQILSKVINSMTASDRIVQLGDQDLNELAKVADIAQSLLKNAVGSSDAAVTKLRGTIAKSKLEGVNAGLLKKQLLDVAGILGEHRMGNILENISEEPVLSVVDFSLLTPEERVKIVTENSEYVLQILDGPNGREIRFESGTGSLVGTQDILTDTVVKTGNMLRYGSEGHTSPIKKIEIIKDIPKEEKQEISEQLRFDEKVRDVAMYAELLDKYVEATVINPSTGLITFQNENVTFKPGKLLDAQNVIMEKYQALAQNFIEELRNQPGVLDVKVVLGAVVMTFDSSKHIESISTRSGGHVITPDSNPTSARGNHYGPSVNYAGLLAIDLNPSKRTKDAISPTVSAIHELHHHTKLLVDVLVAKTNLLSMKSSVDSSAARYALLGIENVGTSTERMYMEDAAIYSKILGREFDSNNDIERMRDQRQYLNELHSSFLQRKENWFIASNTVYSNKKEGKHWELVGNHTEDIAATKRLLGYMEGLYSLETLRLQTQQNVQQGRPIGPMQQKLITDFQDTYRRCGSLIGTARTVIQAERFISNEWQKIHEEYRDLINNQAFSVWMEMWENGTGVEDIRTILGIEKIS